jgi:hypothetical protein
VTRSSKKPPYVEERLMERILRMNENNERRMLKTWSRASVIYPNSSVTPSPYTTGVSTCPCSARRAWSATSSASSPRREPSVPT